MSIPRTTVAAAIWVPLVVLAVDPNGWYPFGPSKWLLVSAGVLILGATTTLAAKRVTVVPRVQLIAVVLVAVFALSAAVGIDHTYAWVGTPERHFGVITWALLAVVLFIGINLVRPDLLVWGIAVAGAALGAAATAEAVGWEPRVFDVDDRLSATYGSPAYLGAAVALLVPIVVAATFDGALPRRLRMLAGVSTPLLLVAVLGSGSARGVARTGGRRLRDRLAPALARWRRPCPPERSWPPQVWPSRSVVQLSSSLRSVTG